MQHCIATSERAYSDQWGFKVLSPIRIGFAFALLVSVSVSAAEPVKEADTAHTVKAAKPRTADASGTEVEFWRSAERLNSPAAYKAYLAQFPSGTFSALARIALSSSERGGAVATPSEAPLGATGGLKPFSAAADNTRVIDFDLGTRLLGPGPLTVGAGDFKKQILLPSGEWILLSAVDSKSAQPTGAADQNSRIDLTTVTFGKFDGVRLISLMRFTLSGKKAAIAKWPDLDGCDEGGAARLYHARSGSWQDRCVGLRVSADPLKDASTVRDETRKSLTGLGARVEGLALVSVLTFADRQAGYLGVRRVDWLGHLPAFASDKESSWRGEKLAEDPARTAYIRSLVAWAQGYGELAQKGLTREIGQADVTSDEPDTASASLMDDFDPVRVSN